MIESPIVLKNFLTEKEIKEIQKVVFEKLPFYYNDSHIYGDEKSINDDSEYFLSHILYDNLSPNSDFYPFFISIFQKFLEKNNLYFRSILRARVNFYPKTDDKVGTPHVDWKFDHNVFIYYINNSDGDTIIYKENFDNKNIFKNFNVLKKISPEEGKGVIFNGSNFHSISYPKNNNKRVILNISYL